MDPPTLPTTPAQPPPSTPPNPHCDPLTPPPTSNPHPSSPTPTICSPAIPAPDTPDHTILPPTAVPPTAVPPTAVPPTVPAPPISTPSTPPQPTDPPAPTTPPATDPAQLSLPLPPTLSPSAVIPPPPAPLTSPESTDQLQSNASPKARTRAVQHVTTLAQRRLLARWMVAEVARTGSSKHIASKAVRQYAQLFPGNAKANLMRASRIWRQRAVLLPPAELNGGAVGIGDALDSSAMMMPGVSDRIEKQALPGRGRKRAGWSEALQQELLTVYSRLCCAGMVFQPRSLKALASMLLEGRGGTAASGVDMVDTQSSKEVVKGVTSRWVRMFADRFRIVLDDRAGKNVPAARVRQFEGMDRWMAYKIGRLRDELVGGRLSAADVESLGVFHFLLNPENGRTLGFDPQVEEGYEEMWRGSRGITLLVRLSGGRQASLVFPFMILQSDTYEYPIVGVPDNMDNVAYRTSPNGWIDERVLSEYCEEKKVFPPLPNGRKRVMYVDPLIWQKYAQVLEPAFKKVNTELRFFPTTGAGTLNPVERIMGPHIRIAWAKRWQEMKTRMIDLGIWNSDGRDANGKKFNPGPRYFLKLAAAVVKDVNDVVRENGMSLTRYAMISSGLALNDEGQWGVGQLREELRTIVTKYLEHFNGLPGNASAEAGTIVTVPQNAEAAPHAEQPEQTPSQAPTEQQMESQMVTQ